MQEGSIGLFLQLHVFPLALLWDKNLGWDICETVHSEERRQH